jgi:hypothetical protein
MTSPAQNRHRAWPSSDSAHGAARLWRAAVLRRFLPWCGLNVLLALAATVSAQQAGPHIGYVYPAGGRQGSSFQIIVGGQGMDSVTNVYVSGSGIKATVIEYVKPITQGQFNTLRDRLKELMEQKAASAKTIRRQGRAGSASGATNITWTAEKEKEIEDIRKKIATFVRRPSSPAIVETAAIQVTVDPAAEPGEREIRVSTPNGLSNPLMFCVGQLAEQTKRAAKPGSEVATATAKALRAAAAVPASGPPVSITLPAMVNGQLAPGGVDRHKFTARKGQHLVAVVNARKLIPYIADAVPGWFQATLALYDSKGKEVAYDDDFRFHPDPVLHCEIPRDGEFTLEIKDAIYRGREDFVYRIEVGELPFITSIFPLGGAAGRETAVELKGWNLPTNRMTLHPPPNEGAVAQNVSLRKGELVSNRVPFAWDTRPGLLEKEPNNSPESAQLITLPVMIDGRIDKPGDRDVFRFEGRAGDRIVAEVHARRLESPVDSVLRLTDAAGRPMAFNDDHEDKGSGLNTHHADSLLSAQLPGDGVYFLTMGDTQGHGGEEYGYRLRVSALQPDFELRLAPSSVNVRGGASVPITVFALRKDGFSNEIALVLRDAPQGFALAGARIPANQDQVRLTLTAPAAASREPTSLVVEGRATIEGRRVTRQAVPAEDMMQAFAYRHLVPADEFLVAVSSRGASRNSVKILSATPVRIPAGGSARVRVGLPLKLAAGKIHLELSEPPEGVMIKEVIEAGFGSEILLECDAAKAKPGLSGNLIVNAFITRADQAKAANRPRAPIGCLPAIPFEIVAR